MSSQRRQRVVVFDLGNVVVAWDPLPAIAVGVGAEQARAFLATDELSFSHWNLAQDAGRTWAEGVAWLEQHHPRWAPHGRSYAENFDASITGRIDGTRLILSRLRARGVRVAALTNWSAETFPRTRARFDELSWFEDIVVSGDERVAKPDQRIFRIVEQRLGVDPAAIVFTDDTQHNIAGAKAAGWDAIHFTDAATLASELRARDLLD